MTTTMPVTAEQLEELRALGTLDERNDNTLQLTIETWTDADDDAEDSHADSYIFRVENIVPAALCEHTDDYDNGGHVLRLSFPTMTYFVCYNGGADASDDLAAARAGEESENRRFETSLLSLLCERGGSDAFIIVRAINSDHALSRAARGPYEARVC
jgi:hypothetical protein